jgi:hypothetical protein
VLFIGGAIAGGGGGDGDSPEPTATTVAQAQSTDAAERTDAPTEEPTAEPTDEPEPTEQPTEEEAESRCEPVDDVVVDGISEGLTIEGGGSLRNAQAVKTDDHEDIWFVAADLQGPGLEGSGDIAIWAVNDLEAPSAVFAVDAVAKEFSDWGEGTRVNDAFGTSDDGAQEARGCAQAAGE